MRSHVPTYILWFICLFFALLTHGLITLVTGLSSSLLQSRGLDGPLLPRGDRGDKRKKAEGKPPSIPRRRASARIQGLPPSGTINPTPSRSQTQSPALSDGRERQRRRHGSPVEQDPARAQGLAQGLGQARGPSPVHESIQDAGPDRRLQLVPFNQPSTVRQYAAPRAAAARQLIRQQAGLPPEDFQWAQNAQVCHESWSVTCRLTFTRTAIQNRGPNQSQSTNLPHLPVGINPSTRNEIFQALQDPMRYWQAPSHRAQMMNQGAVAPPSQPYVPQALRPQRIPSPEPRQGHYPRGPSLQGLRQGAGLRSQQTGRRPSIPDIPVHMIHQTPVDPLVPLYDLRSTHGHDQTPRRMEPSIGGIFNQGLNQAVGGGRAPQNIASGSYNPYPTSGNLYQGRSSFGGGNPQQQALLGGGPLHFHNSPSREQTWGGGSYWNPDQVHARRLREGSISSRFNPNDAQRQAYGSGSSLQFGTNQLQRQVSTSGGGGPLHFDTNQPQRQDYGGASQPQRQASAFGGGGPLYFDTNQPQRQAFALGGGGSLHFGTNQPQRQASPFSDVSALHFGHQPQQNQYLGSGTLHLNPNQAQTQNRGTIHLTPTQIQSYSLHTHQFGPIRFPYGSSSDVTSQRQRQQPSTYPERPPGLFPSQLQLQPFGGTPSINTQGTAAAVDTSRPGRSPSPRGRNPSSSKSPSPSPSPGGNSSPQTSDTGRTISSSER